MGTPDSREYDRLRDRGFKPYSKGHRRMYEIAIEEIGNLAGPRGARVLEAGFGIGWGLDQMLAADILRNYVGYEPNRDSFVYVADRLKEHERNVDLALFNMGYEPNLSPDFDFGFCIEVIEHVPGKDHLRFLKGLRSQVPVLYFSTPDIQKVPKEGVRTTREWKAYLHAAGFNTVTVNESHWTHLFRCS